MRTYLFTLLFSLLTLSFAAPAMAQSDEEIAAARGHYERGQSLAQSGRWREAYVEFQAGFELSERPAFLFNMAECVRQTGDAARARDLYARYLAADPNGPLAEQARARVQELGPAPTPVVTAPPPTTPAPVETTRPVVAAPPASPPSTQPAPVASAETSRPAVPIIPTDNRGRDDDSGGSVFSSWPFWTGVGVVVAGGVVAAILLSNGGNNGPTCGEGCVDLR